MKIVLITKKLDEKSGWDRHSFARAILEAKNKPVEAEKEMRQSF